MRSVFTYLRTEVERKRFVGKIRSAEMLRTTLNHLEGFRQGEDFGFEEFTSEMMEKFQAHLKDRRLMRNTIGFYMRQLRAVYNSAVGYGFVEDCRPFRHVYTGKDKTEKRALTLREIKALNNLDLSGRPQLEFARDMFIFSFCARGMSWVDMAYLRKSDLRDTHFRYNRCKTGQPLCVELVPQIKALLTKYATPPTPFLLPIITNPSRDIRHQCLAAQARVTRNLKKVAELAGISQNLTMHSTRHSWATIARDMHQPISVISKALGHDSEKTTQIYLDSIRNNVVDKVNREILKRL